MLGAGDLPDRVRDEDQEDARRPRHRRLRARVQPSDQNCRAHRHARYHLGRPARSRHRPLRDLERARRLSRQSRRDQEDLGRIRALPAEDVDAGALRLPGPLVVDAGARHHPQAVPEAASADVGGGHQPGHRDRRGRTRPRRARHSPSARFKEQEDKVKHYRKIIANCEPVGSFVNDKVSTVNFLFCHEDTETGNKVGRRLLGTFNFLAAQLRRRARGVSHASLIHRSDCCRRCAAKPSGPGDEAGVPEGIAIGDPERVLRACKKWESVGVDRVNFLLNALETVPQEQVLNSLRLFAKHVMPHFQDERRRQRPRREVALMPAFGKTATFARSPRGNINGYKTEALDAQGRADPELHRDRQRPVDDLMPVTMHPAIPAYAMFNVTHFPESAGGPFTIAEVRVGGPRRRASARLRPAQLCRQRRSGEGAGEPMGFSGREGRRVPARPARSRGRARESWAARRSSKSRSRTATSSAATTSSTSRACIWRATRKTASWWWCRSIRNDVFSKAERGKPRVVALDPGGLRRDSEPLNVMNPIMACFTTGGHHAAEDPATSAIRSYRRCREPRKSRHRDSLQNGKRPCPIGRGLFIFWGEKNSGKTPRHQGRTSGIFEVGAGSRNRGRKKREEQAGRYGPQRPSSYTKGRSERYERRELWSLSDSSLIDGSGAKDPSIEGRRKIWGREEFRQNTKHKVRT